MPTPSKPPPDTLVSVATRGPVREAAPVTREDLDTLYDALTSPPRPFVVARVPPARYVRRVPEPGRIAGSAAGLLAALGSIALVVALALLAAGVI